MSTKGIEQVLSRAMSDNTFADQLFADPEKALTGFDLTSEEIAKFKGMSRNDLSAMTSLAPEERKSFSMYFKEPGKLEFPNSK